MRCLWFSVEHRQGVDGKRLTFMRCFLPAIWKLPANHGYYYDFTSSKRRFFQMYLIETKPRFTDQISGWQSIGPLSREIVLFVYLNKKHDLEETSGRTSRNAPFNADQIQHEFKIILCIYLVQSVCLLFCSILLILQGWKCNNTC